jgi:hypothetical protein
MNPDKITPGITVYDPVYTARDGRKHVTCYVPVEILSVASEQITYRWNGAITRTDMRTTAAGRFVEKPRAGVQVARVGEKLSYV